MQFEASSTFKVRDELHIAPGFPGWFILLAREEDYRSLTARWLSSKTRGSRHYFNSRVTWSVIESGSEGQIHEHHNRSGLRSWSFQAALTG
jgi:hypothetical protein